MRKQKISECIQHQTVIRKIIHSKRLGKAGMGVGLSLKIRWPRTASPIA